MANYRVRFYEDASGWVYFTADTPAEAETLFEQLQNGDIFEDDLPNASRSTKAGQNDYSDLEEV